MKQSAREQEQPRAARQLAELLRGFRARADLSIEDLEDHTKIPAATLYRWERPSGRPPMSRLAELLQFYLARGVVTQPECVAATALRAEVDSPFAFLPCTTTGAA